MKEKIKKYWLSFLIPVLIMIVALVSYQCFIFQDTSILLTDMKGQYISLFAYFKDVLMGYQSLFYSFSKGLGGNMFGTFAYYLASPLNLLILFFSKANLEAFIIIILLLKIGLSGLTMNIFLNDVNEKNQKMNLLLSICYALNSFIINYFYNIIWLDALYLLPLVALGLNNIIKDKKPTLYIVSLALSLCINYYMGYMLCIFSVLFFIYQLVVNYSIKKDKQMIKRAIYKFFISSLLAGICSAIILIPTFLELQETPRSFGSLTSSFSSRWLSILDISNRIFLGSNSSEKFLLSNNINIYCGFIVVILVYLYFFNNKTSKKDKISTGILVLFFILSAICPYLNYIWHGLNFPQGFANRFTFIFMFFLIFIASKSFSQLDINLKKEHYYIVVIIYLINGMITYFCNDTSNNLFKIYVSCAVFIINVILISILFSDKYEYAKNKIFMILFLVVCAELFFNISLSFYKGFTGEKEEYKDFYNIYLEKIKKNEDNSNFYRIEKDYNFSQIDSFIGNYSGVTAFLSTNHSNIQDFTNVVGIATKNNSYSYDVSGTEFMDDILGIKTIVSTNSELKNYRKVDTFKFSTFSGLLYNLTKTDVNIYSNEDSLSLGYMISPKVKNVEDEIIQSNFYTQLYYQNFIFKSMLNTDKDMLVKVDYEIDDNGNYVIDGKKDKTYYIEYRKGASNDCNSFVTINDKYVHDGSKLANSVISYKALEDEKITYSFSYSGKCDDKLYYSNIWIYEQQDDVLEDGIKTLSEQQLQVEKNTGPNIVGSISVKEDSTLFLTIPYDKGWHVYVDGKEIQYEIILNSFMGLDLKKGNHKIELKYEVPGLQCGAIISGIGIVIASIYCKFSKEKVKT